MIYTVSIIGDSPKLHTGLGVLVNQIALAMVGKGIKVCCYGLHDIEPDTQKKLPGIEFHEVNPIDKLGHDTFGLFLGRTKPDIIMFVTDPGNLYTYMEALLLGKQGHHVRKNDGSVPPVIAWIPIEGELVTRRHYQGMKAVEATGGKVVLWNQAACRKVKEQYPDLSPEIVGLGLDHANFRSFSDKERSTIRQAVGLDEFFVIGNVGVNKRTKGHPTLIYAAEIFKREFPELAKRTKFYLHCHRNRPTMDGYPLHDMTVLHGVDDMFLWKQTPDPEEKRNYWLGLSRDGDLDVSKIDSSSMQGRYAGFQNLSFVQMMNCFDLFVDMSQIEGWGLPLGEAMACGIPSISIDDNDVRSEIYSEGALMLKPIAKELWDTWHIGSRLIKVDPNDLVVAIKNLMDFPEERAALSHNGFNVSARYKWADSCQSMMKILDDVYCNREKVKNVFVSTSKAVYAEMECKVVSPGMKRIATQVKRMLSDAGHELTVDKSQAFMQVHFIHNEEDYKRYVDPVKPHILFLIDVAFDADILRQAVKDSQLTISHIDLSQFGVQDYLRTAYGFDMHTFYKMNYHRNFGILTTGWIDGPEIIGPCHEAAAQLPKSAIHIGPPGTGGNKQGNVTFAFNISDDELREFYNRSQFVAGMRDKNGFELPVIEGAACGCRPICLDREGYRHWFSDFAVFTDGTPEDMANKMSQYEPLTAAELKAVHQFEWSHIRKFWWRHCKSLFQVQL